MSSLISVKDRLPKNKGYYLCVLADNVRSSFYDIRYFDDGKFLIRDYFERELNRRVIYWMPLPEIPERENDND